MRTFSGLRFLPFAALIACGQLPTSQIGANSTDPQQDEAPKSRDPAFYMTESQIIAQYSNSSCNAMDGDMPVVDIPGSTDPDYRRGLRGVVATKPTTGVVTDWRTLDRYAMPDAVPLTQTLYFDQLNVPTRLFTGGFPTLNGDYVKGPDGQRLIEYFRIDFAGFLERPEAQGTEQIELAFIADDGIRLRMGDDMHTVIQDPIVTPSKLMCAAAPITMDSNSSIPMALSYFQGPRQHIALMMLWRVARPGQPEPFCGQSGNDLWFDWTKVPSVATPKYKELATRGWSVVGKNNFRLPPDESLNPCLSPRVKQVFDNLRDGSTN